MLRRIGVLTSLAVTAAMFAGVTSAQAQEGGSCVFTGVAGGLTPPLPAIQSDGPPDFEQGSYGFSGDATCAGVIGGVTFIPGAAPNATITSDGFYDNLHCGTGLAHDTNGASTTLRQNDGPGVVENVGYVIEFTAGNGALEIGSGTIPNNPGQNLGSHADGGSGSGAHGNVTGAFTGGGAVHIQPVDGNCATTNVSTFDVSGDFTAAAG